MFWLSFSLKRPEDQVVIRPNTIGRTDRHATCFSTLVKVQQLSTRQAGLMYGLSLVGHVTRGYSMTSSSTVLFSLSTSVSLFPSNTILSSDSLFMTAYFFSTESCAINSAQLIPLHSYQIRIEIHVYSSFKRISTYINLYLTRKCVSQHAAVSLHLWILCRC